MSTIAPISPDVTAAGIAPADPLRFRALWIIAIAQLMVVLDASVVTVALPSAQAGLHISVANRQWVVTAYTWPSAVAAARRPHRRFHGPQADVRDQPGRLRRRLRAGRTGPERGHALRSPGPPRGVRRHHGSRRPVLDHRHLHRGQRTSPGLRGLRRHLRRRRRHRADPGRSADPVRLVALDAADQRADRPDRRRPLPPGWSRRAGPRATCNYDVSRSAHRHRRTGGPGLRLHQSRVRRLGVIDHVAILAAAR
jgi:hypothetical protein